MLKAARALVWSIVVGSSLVGQAEIQVNTYTNNRQSQAAIGMNSIGETVVVWQSSPYDGRGGGIFGQRLTADGSRVGTEFKISDTPHIALTMSPPSVAVEESGNFVVAWTNNDGDKEGIVARHFDRNASPMTGEFRVNTYTSLGQASPNVAVRNDGGFIVTWESWHGIDDHNGEARIAGQMFNASAQRVGSEFEIETVPHGWTPKVAVSHSGDFVVAWEREGDSDFPPLDYTTRMRLFSADGTAKGYPVDISPRDYANSIPSLAMDGDGNYIVAWRYHPTDYTLADVYAQRFDASGNPIGETFMVNSSQDGQQGSPSIAMAHDGRFLISWMSGPVSNRDIFAQWYSREGQAIGSEFRVNSYVSGDQMFPVTAMDNTGRAMIVWESNLQDGSGNGIFADSFQVPEPTSCLLLVGGLVGLRYQRRRAPGQQRI